jgi:hypothetical protein
VVSYSRVVATGAFWETVLVVASGAPFIPPCRLVPHSLLRTHRGQRPRSAFERFIPARAGGTLYRTYFAKKMLTYLEASRQHRYIHERWPVSKRVNSSRASGDDSTLIERSRDDR